MKFFILQYLLAYNVCEKLIQVIHSMQGNFGSDKYGNAKKIKFIIQVWLNTNVCEGYFKEKYEKGIKPIIIRLLSIYLFLSTKGAFSTN